MRRLRQPRGYIELIEGDEFRVWTDREHRDGRTFVIHDGSMEEMAFV
jgi:hypothetical protein